MTFNRINENYSELKQIHEELANRKYEDDGARFEDVSDELAELDRIGKVDFASYTDYYQMVQNSTSDFKPLPSGVNAKNPNYNYRGIYEYSTNRNK